MMIRSRKFMLAGGLFVAFAVLGIFLFRYQAPSPITHDPKLKLSNLEVAALWSCQEESLEYELSYHSSGEMKNSKLFGLVADTHIRTSLEGLATITCFFEDSDETKLEMKFASTSFSSDGVNGEQDIRFDEKEVYFTRTKSGEISDLVFHPAMTQMERHVVRDILSQISIKVKEPLSQWQSEEVDVNGRYLATYEVSNSDTLIKMRRNYLTDKTFTRRREQIIVAPQSLAKFKVSSGSMESLEANLSLSFMQNGEEFAENDVHLSLLRRRIYRQISVDEALQRYVELSQNNRNLDDLSGRALKLSQKERLERSALGADDWDSILNQMTGSDDLTASFLKLKALFYLKPEQCENALEYLLETDVNDPYFHNMSAALLQAGNKEAQEAMLKVALNHKDEKSRMAVIGQLGLFDKPDLLVEQGLRVLRAQSTDQELVQTINLALANIGRTVKPTDRYQQTLRESLASLISCEEYAACLNALHVMGNLGASEVLPMVSGVLESPDPTLRAAAAGALRFVEHVEAERILIRILQSDTDAEVRKAAAIELSFRLLEQTSINQMLHFMEREESANVRMQILNSLGAIAELDAMQKEKLKVIAQKDGASQVRQKALNLLE